MWGDVVIPVMNEGMMIAMKASEKTIIVAISPDLQGAKAYSLLDKEQQGVLKYALMNFAKRNNMHISFFACLKGLGEVMWGYEKKTTRNRRPCLQLKLRKTITI